MSYLENKENVRYECTCGSLEPITNLYFCRHCLELRCGYCLCHEVDTYYCSACREQLHVSEAKVKKNRCSSCLDCPNCFHLLSVRLGSRSSTDNPKTGAKLYYLSCFNCRWNSRDVGIPDQTVATGNWPVKVNPNSEKLQSFQEYYETIAQCEKTQLVRKGYPVPKRCYSSYTDLHGVTSMMAKKRAGLLSLPLLGKDKIPAKIPPIVPSEASENVEPLPSHFLTDVPDLMKLTRLPQRHANPALQAQSVDELYPVSRHLWVKRSLRCKQCEHNVSKPEYSPTSIKFKILLAALYHTPEVKVMTVQPLYAGKSSEIILKLVNPTQHVTSVQFSPLPTKKEELLAEERMKSIKESSNGDPTAKLQAIEKKISNLDLNTEATLPNCAVVLPPRDDAAEYDDSGEKTHSYHDDQKVVVWRKGNKAALKFTISPKEDLPPGTETLFGFCLDYVYVNSMPSAESRTQQVRVDIPVKIYINPGVTLS